MPATTCEERAHTSTARWSNAEAEGMDGQDAGSWGHSVDRTASALVEAAGPVCTDQPPGMPGLLAGRDIEGQLRARETGSSARRTAAASAARAPRIARV